MSDNAKVRPINKEQKKVIAELEEVLNFLISAQIEKEEDLETIKKPLDDLKSSLKYIPTQPLFETIPSEIKTKILSYLCDSNAFIAASVCQDWKEILQSRFSNKTVNIGGLCCTNKCRDNTHECLERSLMLRASATHKMDVHLSICSPPKLTEVDSKIVTDALTSVSKFSLSGDCTCGSELDEYDYDETFGYRCELNPLSLDQLKDLFKGLEKKPETMENVKLDWLDLNQLNQDRLINCFVNKIKNLTLIENKYTRGGKKGHGKMFNIETLINKLKNQPNSNLEKLNLDILDYPAELALEFGLALCNVKKVKLGRDIHLRSESVTQLFENILTDTRPVLIQTLIVNKSIVFRTFINPEDLKRLFIKMSTLQLQGTFTLVQVETARSIPDVSVLERELITFIQKGSDVFYW